jgi:hypothetical protein
VRLAGLRHRLCRNLGRIGEEEDAMAGLAHRSGGGRRAPSFWLVVSLAAFALAVAAVALPGLAAAAAVQPAAVLTPVTVIGGADFSAGVNRLGVRPADLFAGLTPMATRKLASGVTVGVWRYTDKPGVCERGREAATCPRIALLISTTPDSQREAQFGLWSSSARLAWRVSSDQPGSGGGGEDLDFRMDSCEAPTAVDAGAAAPHPGDDWRWSAYAVKISRYGAISFVRLEAEGPQGGCLPG